MIMPTRSYDRSKRPAVARPLAATLSLGASHETVIDQSHERCEHIGLSRIHAADYGPLARPDLATVRERNRRLSTHAAPVIEMLFDQIAGTQSMIVLTDACGTILHSKGDDDFLAKASKVALQPGVNWAEASKGTNAIGTALIEERATVVFADEHYLHANQFLSCQASPIVDARGNILGVLDVTGDHRRFHEHTMGLVKMSARMIENHWFVDEFATVMRLHLHSRVEFIGTLMEGIVAVARDGAIVGANRAALDHLGLSSAAVRLRTVGNLLGTSVAALVDHFRSPLAMPLVLQLPNGAPVHVSARFNWPTLHSFALPVEASAAKALDRSAAASARTAAAPSGLARLETGDAQMATLVDKVRRVLNRDIPILLLGETGTGKELLARAIHHDSQRASKPFVAVNCASMAEAQIEAELFGSEAAASAGARRTGAAGKIVQADGGTLFLDQVGDLPLPLQARLLRVLQERQITPPGSAEAVAVDIAVIVASHCHLRELIEAGRFREDLYHGLNGLAVKLPPLRQRSDLAALARGLLAGCCPERTPVLGADVVRLFEASQWPGNVRQLANVLRTAVVMAGGAPTITRMHLSDDFVEEAESRAASGTPGTAAAAGGSTGRSVVAGSPADPGPETLHSLEIEAIRRAVEAAGGNISAASKMLGISRNTIYRKLRSTAQRGATG